MVGVLMLLQDQVIDPQYVIFEVGTQGDRPASVEPFRISNQRQQKIRVFLSATLHYPLRLVEGSQYYLNDMYVHCYYWTEDQWIVILRGSLPSTQIAEGMCECCQ